MKTVGIICEYNPLHAGHEKQLRTIRACRDGETAIVCLMSGNFVQRGAPALVDKSLRAKAALRCGADLVLELPVEYALSSAEGFAAGGVGILEGFCQELCFGAEDADLDRLMAVAQALLREDFPPLLKAALDRGSSFPAARAQALAHMGLDGDLLSKPNNILAVEYCKALLARHSPMRPLPIPRVGNYHNEMPQAENPSATAVRRLMLQGGNWRDFVPPAAQGIFAGARLHTLSAGERAVLARLRTMTDEEFEALPYGSEGLWRKLMHACRAERTLEDIILATKSKRYTRSRIDRMVLCAFLGLSLRDFLSGVPYVRVLAFNDNGRRVLKEAKKSGVFRNAGEIDPSPYGLREARIGSLYGLFALGGPESPDAESRRRIYYHKENPIPCFPNSDP